MPTQAVSEANGPGAVRMPRACTTLAFFVSSRLPARSQPDNQGQTQGLHDTNQSADAQGAVPYLPMACGDICKVMSPWPGCGKPANEFARLAATEQLKLIGQDPNPSLQRYVDLIGTCYQVLQGPPVWEFKVADQ